MNRFALLLVLMGSAAWTGAAAAQPVRVNETRVGSSLGEVVTVSNGWVRVEVRPREGELRINGQRVSIDRGQWGDDAGDRVAGYAVHRHVNGSATVVLPLRGGADCLRVAYVHVPVGTGVVTLRTVVDNRGSLPALADGQWGMAMREGAEPIGGSWARGMSGAVGRGYTGWYDAAGSASVLAFGGGEGVWGWGERGVGRVVVRGSDPAAERYVGRWCRRQDDVYLVVLPKFGRVSSASPHAVVSAAREDAGWIMRVQPLRLLTSGKVRVTGGAQKFEQTVNAGPGRPMLLEVPIDAASVELELIDAQKRRWLGATLPGDGGGRADAAEGVAAWPIVSLSDETLDLYEGALGAMKRGDAGRAAALLRGAMDQPNDARGSWGFLMYATALIQSGQVEEGRRMLRARVEREPGLVEAWLMLGEWETARSLVRYDEEAWARLRSGYSARLGAALSGAGPTE